MSPCLHNFNGKEAIACKNRRTPLSVGDGGALQQDRGVTEGHEKGVSGVLGTSACTEHANTKEK